MKRLSRNKATLSRRMLLAGGATIAGNLVWARWHPAAASGVVVIHMVSDPQGAHVAFDPVGILVEPGTTIRWICDSNVHTTTAYHPKNGHHCLRIPTEAQPWASDYLLPREHFEVTLSVEGVYDYFCIPHEHAGMVGRIIVGKAIGPGAEPFDYFTRMPQANDWLPVPLVAQKTFPSIETILSKKVVHPT
jgi:plastocyanin